MEIVIDCEAFVRLSKISNAINPNDERQFLKSIWLEALDGVAIAVASNSIIGAIERLENNNPVDCEFLVCVDDTLIQQCIAETPFNSKLTFTYNKILKHVSVKTSFGYVHPTNALIVVNGPNPLVDWREWIPNELPTESNGGMFSTLDNLALLALAAPTGSVIFPEFIDNKKPVIVQDIHNLNWLGVFISSPNSSSRSPEPFSIPEWAK